MGREISGKRMLDIPAPSATTKNNVMSLSASPRAMHAGESTMRSVLLKAKRLLPAIEHPDRNQIQKVQNRPGTRQRRPKRIARLPPDKATRKRCQKSGQRSSQTDRSTCSLRAPGAYSALAGFGVPLGNTCCGQSGWTAGRISGSACVCLLWWQTGNPFWAALARSGAILNLLNLVPVWVARWRAGGVGLEQDGTPSCFRACIALGLALRDNVFFVWHWARDIEHSLPEISRPIPAEPHNLLCYSPDCAGCDHPPVAGTGLGMKLNESGKSSRNPSTGETPCLTNKPELPDCLSPWQSTSPGPGRLSRTGSDNSKILKLRQYAKDQFGTKFDIRAFHDEVLGAGAVRLTSSIGNPSLGRQTKIIVSRFFDLQRLRQRARP